MSRDKQTEIHELAKQMSEAISTEVEQRYIEDEAKLEAVLIANGWRKATDFAREIFEEIERTCENYRYFYEGTYAPELKNALAELKKKRTEEEK